MICIDKPYTNNHLYKTKLNKENNSSEVYILVFIKEVNENLS